MRSAVTSGYLVELFRNATSLDDLQTRLSRHLDDIGFSHYAFELKRGVGSAPAVLSVLCNYPEEFIDRYIAEHYRQHDAVHVHAHRTLAPFGWSDLLQQPYTHAASTLFSEAGEFGIRDGVTVPIRGHDNTISVFSAVPDGIKPERQMAVARHMGELTILASLLHERMWQFHRNDQPPGHEQEVLTRREREVLQWMAVGKTSYETGMILSISAATVNSHAVAICRKLHASSRTHAAVIGTMQGLIDPQ